MHFPDFDSQFIKLHADLVEKMAAEFILQDLFKTYFNF